MMMTLLVLKKDDVDHDDNLNGVEKDNIDHNDDYDDDDHDDDLLWGVGGECEVVWRYYGRTTRTDKEALKR